MAFVRVEQRNARLAGPVKVEFVKARDGEIPKGTVTVISNASRGSGDERSEEATAIQWTLWGTQAQNAAIYLVKGARVNVIGRLRNNNYTNGEGTEVYGYGFTVEEVDYLDSKAESDARRARQFEASQDGKAPSTKRPSSRTRRAGGSHRAAAR
jgi:single-strand DNA-binding protein